jgi:hypothetical protein
MENNNNDKSSQFKKLAIFSMGLKGGTGKTCFASYLYEYFKIASEQRSLGLKVAAYDCDTDVAKFSRIYGIKDANGKYDKIANLKNPFDGVGRIDVKNTNKMDMLLDSIDTGADVLIFDIPGGFARQFGQISGSVATFAGQFAYAGYNLLVCNVIDMSIAAAESTLQFRCEYSPWGRWPGSARAIQF